MEISVNTKQFVPSHLIQPKSIYIKFLGNYLTDKVLTIPRHRWVKTTSSKNIFLQLLEYLSLKAQIFIPHTSYLIQEGHVAVALVEFILTFAQLKFFPKELKDMTDDIWNFSLFTGVLQRKLIQDLPSEAPKARLIPQAPDIANL